MSRPVGEVGQGALAALAPSEGEWTLDEHGALVRTDFRDLPLRSRGKVRDVYDLGTHLLFVASDRISAFDWVLPNGIPDKGKVLTQLSLFWFGVLGDLVPTHLAEENPGRDPRIPARYHAVLAGRAMVVAEGRGLSGGMRRARLSRRIRVEGLPAHGRRLRDRASRWPPPGRAASPAHLHAGDQGRVRPRREHRLRDRRGPRRARNGGHAAAAHARVLRAGRRHRGEPGHHRRGHEVRVRATGRSPPPGRRGADARFVPVLARRPLCPRPVAAVVRQAVRPGLARADALGTRTRRRRGSRSTS